jgi:hypothetical protein
MFIYPRSRKRPFHYGLFPLETLPRDTSVIAVERERPRRAAPHRVSPQGKLVDAADHYREIYSGFIYIDPAAAKAPVPDDVERRTIDVKGAAYFMDASQVGICEIPDNAWLEGVAPGSHRFAVVLLVEDGRLPDGGNLARDWAEPAVRAVSDMRAAEIAALVAGHIRTMGWGARPHFAAHEDLDLERLAVLAGLAVRHSEAIVNPYLEGNFSIAVVSTDYELSCDQPLSPKALNASWSLCDGNGQACRTADDVDPG